MVQRWETGWTPMVSSVARRQEATELFLRDFGLRGFGLLGSTGVPWILGSHGVLGPGTAAVPNPSKSKSWGYMIL